MTEDSDNKQPDGNAPGASTTGSKPPTPSRPTWITFEELVRKEFAHFDGETDGKSALANENIRIGSAGSADEPWVVFTKHDHFGLALSGGGIRSAIFNLGLLQGLNNQGVLQHVDYLSTVSGGGYAGGFWTAWRQRVAPDNQEGPVFPSQDSTNQSDMRERPEIRHLREFSRFLMPRVGFSCAETWSAIVTILSGLLPSLLTTLALTSCLIYIWLGLNYCMTKCFNFGVVACFFGITLVIHIICEMRWRIHGKAGDAAGTWKQFFIWGFITAAAAGIGLWNYRSEWSRPEVSMWIKPGVNEWLNALAQKEGCLEFAKLCFWPAAAWFLNSLGLVIVRFLGSRFGTPSESIAFTNMLDRCIYRCLAPAVVWTGVVLAWTSSLLLHTLSNQSSNGPVGYGAPAIFGGLFAWLRDWLVRPTKETKQSGLSQQIVIKLKPWIPQLLAIATVVSFILAVMFFIQDKGLVDYHRALAFFIISFVILVLMLFLFDPSRVGMHNFYRERIARCFLGAARTPPPPDASTNRQTSEQLGDDLTFDDIQQFLKGDKGLNQNRRRLIHLVCCTANDLSGDVLGNLYRGGRSAVLSPHGISVGNYTNELNNLRFSAALTASAAAFNSQMGSISMELGPAVAMVMSALNLRLGLWVPHPLSLRRKKRGYFVPGRFFLYEMFGLTKCDRVSAELGNKLKIERMEGSRDIIRINRQISALDNFNENIVRLGKLTRNLLLSDGGHFENLGLYELIRRHCRYIIVSDCGADPEVAFDDLANALRHVREDFGVEIDLDVRPLRPGPDKRSDQHAVVGTIHYDGLNGTDKGTILYFKPSLTGDEPPDTIQYQTRNPAFPHESTENQFYDEAQWEAYRRLGEHEANLVLGYGQKTARQSSTSFVENLFLGASQRWHPAPPRQAEVFLELTQRCSELERDVRDTAPAVLRSEFFPEVAAVEEENQPASIPGDENRVIFYVMMAAQIMEDTWLGAELDRYWSHPLNEGWMHYFQRWASMPSFRRWWPILRPLYSSGFADFVKDRFELRIVDYDAGDKWIGPAAKLKLNVAVTREKAAEGLAWKTWVGRYGEPPANKCIFDYHLTLDSLSSVGAIQVGFLLFTRKTETSADGSVEKRIIEWRTSHLFVPHSLIGGGIMARLLDSAISQFRQPSERIDEILVELEEEGVAPNKISALKFKSDLASRQQCVQTINFYKSRGFAYLPPHGDGKIHSLVLRLG